MDPVTAFQHQATACAELGSPLYAELLTRLTDDLATGGATREVLEGHEDDPGPSALALRLLGSVHRLVLERRAGELAAYYPSVGGTWEPDGGTAAFLRPLAEEPDAVRAWLDRAPQTNEVGRAAALWGGLLRLPRRAPVRLFELGASAGLNLLADRFRYVDAAGTVIGPDSPVVLDPAWRGVASAAPLPRIVERVGCDVLPIDATTPEGRLALTGYVWPDQRARLERLRGALRLAQETPPDVRRQGVVELLDSVDLRPGTTTVVWHSVMWQYLTADDQREAAARIADLGERASTDADLAHLALEPVRRTPDSASREFLVVLTTWPGGVRRVLGVAAPHGLPTTWEA